MGITMRGILSAPAKDVWGPELRRRIREEDGERREEALAEHRRRCANLDGAVIPPSELAARGPNPREWAPE